MKHCKGYLASLLWLGCTIGVFLEFPNRNASIVQAQTVPATVSQGYAFLKKGWIKAAIAAFQQALQQVPQSLDAKLGLAIAYQKAGSDQQAWELYQQVLQQDPDNRTALSAIGMLGGYRSEWQATGIAALTTLLQITPHDVASRAQRALLLGYQGRFAEAIADYTVLLPDHSSPDIVLGAAQVYTYSGDYAQGIALFEQYLTYQPVIPDAALSTYALALRETNQADRAVQLLEARLQQRSQLDAIGIELRVGLAVAYQFHGQATDALTLLAPLRDRPDAILPLARALSAIGRHSQQPALYQEAIGLYRQVLQQSAPAPANLILEVADVMSEAVTTQAEALQLYQQLIAQQPNNASLIVKQLILQSQLGQISQSELTQRLQTVLPPLPTSPTEQRSLAQALLKLDAPDPALLPAYQTLWQAGVNLPFLLFRIAQIQMQAGDLAAAQQTLETYRTMPVGAKDQTVDLLLAEIQRRSGELEGSAQQYAAIVANHPNSEIAHSALRSLAGIRQAQGRLAEAMRVYDQLLARHPEDGPAQLGRASLAYQTQQISLPQAEAVLDRWLQTHPNQTPPELFNLVGALPADAKREALYNQLIEIDPGNFIIQTRLIQVLAQRHPDQARSRIDQLIADHPRNMTPYFIQAELAKSIRNLSLASQAYQTILQHQPDNTDALSALGGVRFQQQRFPEAIALFQHVLRLKPQDWETRRILAELQAAQDQPAAALRQLRQLEQEQRANETSSLVLRDRMERLQVDLLKRRGFQPAWEQY